MDNRTLQDKSRGCLVGGAIGDALGYIVEFVGSHDEICARYGADGITAYDLNYDWLDEPQSKALISDDTQMTLYTAEALIEARRNGWPIIPAIQQSYLAWLGPQIGQPVTVDYDSRLLGISELNRRRAPGATCITALTAVRDGRQPSNDSKGCGGVMRVAPVGIYGAVHGLDIHDTARMAGEAAELTHLHPLSTYASAALAVIVQECIVADTPIDAVSFTAIVNDALRTVKTVYGAGAREMSYFVKLMQVALGLRERQLPDWDLIENVLGEGWVAEETLAIAVFAVLRHIDDFDACMTAAVNHGGDSDSTGAVAGNILGAIIGYAALPEKFTADVQFRDLLVEHADLLAGGS